MTECKCCHDICDKIISIEIHSNRHNYNKCCINCVNDLRAYHYEVTEITEEEYMVYELMDL